MLELTAYQRSRLSANEQVFWCGTTRPVARFAAWPLFVVIGVVVGAMFSPFLRVVWGLVRRDGTPTAVKIVFALFALPFVKAAFQRLSECRRAGEAARQTEKMSGVAVV